MVLCCICQRQVFLAEQILFYDKTYHKSCFKCTHCQKTLNPSTASSSDKMPYCVAHVSKTNRTTPIVTKNEPEIIREEKANNSIVDTHTNPVVLRPPVNDTTVCSHPSPTSRSSVLASGYDTFQSQIELAGQTFIIDPVLRQNIFNTFNEFNVMVCGSARVGKSTLINTICGQKLAQSSPGLDSCTKQISRYILNGECRVDNKLIHYKYNFWDTPGFESWNETDIRTNFSAIIQKPKSDPLCMIYCASPGSFADTEQLKWLLNVCITQYHLLCVLVVTNKWAGQKNQRLAVLDKYKEILSTYHQQTCDEDGITYFGNVGLCTMVNAEPYIDEDQGINRDVEGVDELIEAIMICLKSDAKVFHWCIAVMQRKGLFNNFKGKMKQGYQHIKDFIIKRFTAKKN